MSDTCGVAHGDDPGAGEAQDPPVRVLVGVFASPVSAFLLRYGADLGYEPVLLEPDPARPLPEGLRPEVLRVVDVAALGRLAGPGTDLVVTDHHRPELGEVLRDALAAGDREQGGGALRWIGLMGNPRHEGPHVAALAALGVPPAEVARVHRPIGLDIGSRTPAEIAVSTLAGLVADRNGRSGGPMAARR
ncbi:xanthine dehydrogenase [Modestobacter sp. I12A-02628]|uniref:XdhC/CoxF family protein n=1 Tax=Goekera deserti TaxID=2497753 RepID=A0A7K3W827_9ACTN|nr:XdhC family protein [Goekera deserti]MPQ99878.1 xanthine dehydrogenase [Goekera deserti]NDI50037.1 xanthine dehydrogenase [Goekera deserti]NEL52486.1 XdhC/CoxF family protein [Goekera deserti]